MPEPVIIRDRSDRAFIAMARGNPVREGGEEARYTDTC